MKVFLSLCILWVVCSSASQDLPFAKSHIAKTLSSFAALQPAKQQQQQPRKEQWSKVSVYNNLQCEGAEADMIMITNDPSLTQFCTLSLCVKTLTDNSSMTNVCSDETPELPSSSDYFGFESYEDKKCKQLEGAMFFNKKTYPDYKACGLGIYIEFQCSLGIVDVTGCPVAQCGGQDPTSSQCQEAAYSSECMKKEDPDAASGYSYESITGFPCSTPTGVYVAVIFVVLVIVGGCLLCAYALCIRAGAPFKCGKKESEQDMSNEYENPRFDDEDEL